MTMLKERYISAVLEQVPDNQKDEVRSEIGAAIDEMVDQRMGAGESEADAVRSALIELGEPVRFAEAYKDRRQVLIGPDWYPKYISTLKLVTPIVVPTIAVIVLLVEIAINGESLGSAILHMIDAAWRTTIVTLFGVTLGFAIAERAGGPEDSGLEETPWTPEDLPEPASTRRVGLGSTIGTVVMAAIFGGLVFVQGRNGIGFLTRGLPEDLQDAAAINPDIPAGWSWAFFGLILFTIVVAIVRYRGRFWNGFALVLTLMDSLLWSAFIVALAMREPIFNPVLGERIDAGGDWWHAGGQFNSATAVVVILTTLPELWEAVQGYREYRRIHEPGTAGDTVGSGARGR